ncbi:MAG TPA: TonB-dependent receptor [Steroidobacteraceae bacterium]|nr:TonB-dependent receptor [Steroidobacteraceae bacterium]
MRVTVTAIAICMTIVSLSIAEDVHAAIKQPTNIPPQLLAPALQSLAKDRNFQIVYVSEDIGDRRTAGAVGIYTPEEALKQLLSGTGLTYKYLDEKTITIVPRDRPPAKSSTQAQKSQDGVDPPQARSSSLWERLRLAQADQGMVQGSDSVETKGEQASLKTPPALQEIIVTATKRAENLQDVPLAVTALQATELENAGVSMGKALGQLTPNVVIDANVNFVAPYIRGVGTQYADPGLEPSVATYMDDLYISRASGGLLSFSDVERVEVLEGPQGTLYGMNTTGGAIRIITKDPTKDFRAGFGVTAGNYQTYGGDGYVSGPITDAIQGRLAFQYDRNSGFVKNSVPGGLELESRDLAMVRGKLFWNLSDRLTVKLMADYQRKLDHEGQSFLSLYPGAPEVTAAVLGGTPSTGFYTASSDLANGQKNRLQLGGVELRTDYDLDAFRLSSITGWRYTAFQGYADLDTTSIPFFNAHTLQEMSKDWSQELQAISTGEGPLSWIGGLYWYHEFGRDDSGGGGLFGQLATSTPNGFFGGDGQVGIDALAPYGQLTYKITPEWEVLFGARYSVQHKELKGNQFFITTTTTPLGWDPARPYLFTADAPRAEFNSSTLAPKVGITWRPLKGVMLYATYSKGYKSGGFNLPQPSPTPPNEVQDEVLKAIEFGWKMELGSVRFNGAYFHYKANNLQVQVTDINSGIIAARNAAAATTNGAETLLEVAVAPPLTVGAAIGYLDAKFDDFPGGQISTPCVQDPAAPGCNGNIVGVGNVVANLAGNRLPLSPKWSGNVHLSYSRSLPGATGMLNLTATEAYSSSFFFTPDNVYRQPGKGLLNATIGWTSEDGHFGVHAYGTNLASKRYATHVAPLFAGGWYVPGPPREYGARLSYAF